ncbi:DMT family transporter [Actinomadura sp. NPDC048032]|uniref:DMT family transporter n=1 Tax=Actinomadura sp. NPDC048032 TaxID=3155747 RepID=UPI0033FD6105
MNVLAVAIALAASVFFGFAAALQHHAAFHEVRHGLFDVRLLWRLMHYPIWIGGQLTDLVGVALHATALQIGALVLVQPVQVAGLPLSVPMEAALNRRRPHRRDLRGAALATAGLVAFLVAAAPQGGIRHPSGAAWFACGGLVAVTVIGLLALSHFTTRGSRSGASVGLATGVLFGFSAALLKSCTDILATRPLTLPLHWEMYALIGTGLVGMQLNQSAFQHSSLASPLTAMTLGEPLVSVIIGLTAFHEQIRTTPPRLAIIFVAVLAMAYGIWTTSTTWQPPRRPPPDDQADR